MIWDCFWHCETNAIRAISCMHGALKQPCCFPPSGESRRPDFAFFEAQSPGPPIPLCTLQTPPRDATCKTEDQDGVAVSLLVGLFHSLQHASLTRRTLINANWTSGPGT